jgi:hypothetical protein
MSIRETLDKHPRLVLAAVAATVVIGIVVGVANSRKEPLIPSKTKVFFTDDDGKSWYPESGETIAPCDHNGKTAVRCFVFQASGGKEFSAYEEKLPDQVLQQVKQMPPDKRPNMSTLGNQILLKRPGQGEWVSPASPQGRDILNNIAGPDDAVQIIP